MVKLEFTILVNRFKFGSQAANPLLESKVFGNFWYSLLEVIEFIPMVVQIWIDISVVVAEIDCTLVYQNGKKSVSLRYVAI
jgi:hypothetical protein